MTNKPTVLVTGAAGYIGSHAVLAFREAAYPVVVVDDLSTGRRDAVPDDIPFIEADVGEAELVGRVLCEHAIGAVVHFAGSIVIPESVADPLKYYRNNIAASRNLIAACVANHVRYFIFSSTAAVYGHPETVPVPEDAPTAPINPYGTSKLMTEWILRDTAQAHDFRYVALRYFNVAGADPGGRTGQSTPNATHLIKVASQAAVGLRDGVEVFGEDYDTPDGTCIRDYIHVSDPAAAHVDALGHLRVANEDLILNCGYGRGYSVREVLATVEKEAGIHLNIRAAPPRRRGKAGRGRLAPAQPLRVAAPLRRSRPHRPHGHRLGAQAGTRGWEKAPGHLRRYAGTGLRAGMTGDLSRLRMSSAAEAPVF